MKRAAYLAAVLLAILLAKPAQSQAPAKVPRVGMLNGGSAVSNGHFVEAFRRGLADLGYVERRNIVLEIRYADAQFGRLPALTKELGDAQVDVLFAPSALATPAA